MHIYCELTAHFILQLNTNPFKVHLTAHIFSPTYSFYPPHSISTPPSTLAETTWCAQNQQTITITLLCTHLLHVLGDGVLAQELCALSCVVSLCVFQEGGLKVVFVHAQRGSLGTQVLFI